MLKPQFSFLGLILACLTLAQCSKKAQDIEFGLRPLSFQDLKHWPQDNHGQALEAFQKSCSVLMRQAPHKPMGKTYAGHISDWLPVCHEAQNVSDPKLFFELNFKPYQVYSEKTKGLFTGYYEPILEGTKTKNPLFPYPLYTTPQDLIVIEDLGRFNPKLKGYTLSGKIKGNNLIPYEKRSQIDEKGLEEASVLCWVKDEIDSFFLHIQGSGRISLDNGQVLRVGYAAQNGHAYEAIGKFLIADGHLKKEEISLQSIKNFLKTNPTKIKQYLWKNPSYIFFREVQGDGPLGAMNCPLTPGRSMAIDRKFIPLGIPLWLETKASQKMGGIAKLVITQDTGGAIKGPLRGDLFWGHSQDAEKKAGIMKEEGTYSLLLPKNLKVDIDAASY